MNAIAILHAHSATLCNVYRETNARIVAFEAELEKNPEMSKEEKDKGYAVYCILKKSSAQLQDEVFALEKTIKLYQEHGVIPT